MDLLGALSSRQSEVKNERLKAEISKVCEELTNGIIELSEKAKKLNELKEQYNKSSSELQESATSDENGKPAEKKGFLSNLFSFSGLSGLSGNNKTPEAPPPTPNVSESLDAETNPLDNTHQPDVLPDESSMLAASAAVPEQPASSFASLSETPSVVDKPLDNPFGSNDSSSSSSDIFSPPSNDVLPASVPAQVPNSLGTPPVPTSVPAQVPASVPAQVPNSLGAQQQAPGVDADDMSVSDNDSTKIGGKKKKSKRSKKTISNSTKKSRNLTRKKKNISHDTTARP
jgi:hypothetical protein